jgi:hypothetical protein
MNTLQRVSRGFHRLALVLAAIPLVVGIALSVLWGIHDFQVASSKHEKLACAHAKAGTVGQPWTIPWDAFVKGQNPFNDLIPLDNREVSLQKLGCSEWEYDTAKFGEIRDVSPKLNRLGVFAPPLMQGLAITLAITLAVYGIVRAIGWVIGGFAAS